MASKSAHAIAEPNPTDFFDYREYLYQVYLARKNQYSSYSFVRLAEDLGFPPTSILHQIIKGKRPLTKKAAQKIIAALHLHNIERRYFLTLIDHNNSTRPDQREARLRDLLDLKIEVEAQNDPSDHTDYFGSWYHVVIREMAALPGFIGEPEQLAASLRPNIKPAQAKESLEFLERTGLIRFDKETGRYVQSDSVIATPSRASGAVMIRFQEAMIDLGKDSIANTAPDDRYVAGNTFRLSKSQMEALKVKVHEFFISILENEAPADETDDIYQLNLQLFPVTALGKGKGDL